MKSNLTVCEIQRDYRNILFVFLRWFDKASAAGGPNPEKTCTTVLHYLKSTDFLIPSASLCLGAGWHVPGSDMSLGTDGDLSHGN